MARAGLSRIARTTAGSLLAIALASAAAPALPPAAALSLPLETPSLPVRTPAVEIETPHVTVTTPSTPARAPTVSVHAPTVTVKAPTVSAEAPAVSVKAPSVSTSAAPAVKSPSAPSAPKAPVAAAKAPSVATGRPTASATAPEVAARAGAPSPSAPHVSLPSSRAPASSSAPGAGAGAGAGPNAPVGSLDVASGAAPASHVPPGSAPPGGGANGAAGAALGALGAYGGGLGAYGRGATPAAGAQSGGRAAARIAAREHVLQAAVERFYACLGDLPASQRELLELRAGVGEPQPLAPAAVAARLHVGATAFSRLERRALLDLADAASTGSCGRATTIIAGAAAFIASAFGERPGAGPRGGVAAVRYERPASSAATATAAQAASSGPLLGLAGVPGYDLVPLLLIPLFVILLTTLAVFDDRTRRAPIERYLRSSPLLAWYVRRRRRFPPGHRR